MTGQCFVQHALETKFIEHIICLKKFGGINNVSRKFLAMCKIHVAYHRKGLLNFCITSNLYPNYFKILDQHLFRRMVCLVLFPSKCQFRCSVTSAICFRILYTSTLKISDEHQVFMLKISWVSVRTGS